MIYVNSLDAMCTAGARRLNREGSSFSLRRVKATSSSRRTTDFRSSDLSRSRPAFSTKRIRRFVTGVNDVCQVRARALSATKLRQLPKLDSLEQAFNGQTQSAGVGLRVAVGTNRLIEDHSEQTRQVGLTFTAWDRGDRRDNLGVDVDGSTTAE